MNQEIKAKFVAALRSDKYEKTKGYLRRGNCFCVFGVLCDVVDPDGWQPLSVQLTTIGARPIPVYEHRNCLALPSKALLQQVGLDEESQQVLRLYDKNDNTDATFAEMADEIEQWN